MTWQRYLPRTRVGVAPNDVRLSKSGDLVLGAEAFNTLGSPKRVALYFDRATTRLGVQAATAFEPNTLKVSTLSNALHMVACGGMLDFHHIKIEMQMCPAAFESGMLIVGPLLLEGAKPEPVVSAAKVSEMLRSGVSVKLGPR